MQVEKIISKKAGKMFKNVHAVSKMVTIFC